MIGKVIITGVILFLPICFSLVKSAANAERQLEEIQEAFFRKEECSIEKTSEEK